MSSTLPKGCYIFEWGGLIAKAGGLTKAMLTRLSAFVQDGADVRVLLSARGLEQIEAIEYYKAHGFPLLKDSQFVTMEDYLSQKLSKEYKGSPLESLPELIKSLSDLFSYSENNKTLYFKQGNLVAELSQAQSRNRVEVVFHNYHSFETGTKIIFWKGKPRRIFDPIQQFGSEKIRIERFFSENGFCFARFENAYRQNQWKVLSVDLFSTDGSMTHFETQDAFRRFFFSDYVNNLTSPKNYVFCDPFLDFNPGFGLMEDTSKHQVIKIALCHGIGLGGSRQWHSPINPRTNEVVAESNPPELDALILLSREALSDYRKRLGRRSLLYVLPNTIPLPILDSENQRDRNSAIFIGRIDEKQKQISHIVKAFRTVALKYPEKKLHIYGRGGDEGIIKKLISDLNLENNVFLEGYTSNVEAAFQTAAFSVMASPAEGFSLACLESLANGCPAITYSCKYGPRDIIEDGKNGSLVAPNDIDALGAAMIRMFELPAPEYNKMTEQARKSAEPYDSRHFLSNWAELLNQIEQNKRKFNSINDIDFSISKITTNLSTKGIGRKISGSLLAYGRKNDSPIDTLEAGIKVYNNDRTDYITHAAKISLDQVVSKDNRETIAFTFDVILHPSSFNHPMSVYLNWENTFIEKDLIIGL